MRLIDADAYLKRVRPRGIADELWTASETYLSIMRMPPVDAVPVRKGHWIERESGTEDKENGFATVIVCSCCDFPATTFYSEDCESRTQIRTDFCPNCGARMDGKGDGNGCS